jgi:hypothetical protein
MKIGVLLKGKRKYMAEPIGRKTLKLIDRTLADGRELDQNAGRL